MTDETETPIAPWTIKGIPPEDRNAAIAAATREHMTIGGWMCRAIRSQIQAERQQNRQPVVVEAPSPALPASPAAPALDVAELRVLVELAETTATGSVPRSLARTAQSIIRNRLREIRRSAQP